MTTPRPIFPMPAELHEDVCCSGSLNPSNQCFSYFGDIGLESDVPFDNGSQFGLWLLAPAKAPCFFYQSQNCFDVCGPAPRAAEDVPTVLTDTRFSQQVRAECGYASRPTSPSAIELERTRRVCGIKRSVQDTSAPLFLVIEAEFKRRAVATMTGIKQNALIQVVGRHRAPRLGQHDLHR